MNAWTVHCLGDIDDYSLNVEDLGCSDIDDHELAVNQSNQYDFVPRDENVLNFEDVMLDVDDQENQSNLARAQGVRLMEKQELATEKYCNVHENSSSAMNQNQEMGIAIDAPAVQSRIHVNVPGSQLTDGQQFPDAQSCRRAIRDAAIAQNFVISTIKSDKVRFIVKCAFVGCPWRIHASKLLPDVPTFTITFFCNEHTCGGITHLGHQQASVQWIEEFIERSLRKNPYSKPKEIMKELHQVHGISLLYNQVQRVMDQIRAAVYESFKEEFHLLPQYFHQIGRTNPGSTAVVYGNPVDSSFERLFVSLQASIYGFLNACCPLIVLHEMVLKRTYHGTVFMATSFDGEGALFPLAFAMVDDESNDGWTWFLSELHNLLEANTGNMPRLTILSDRQKSITDGIELHFPSAFHGFNILHLIDNFSKEFNDNTLVNLLWEAACAFTTDEFEQKITLIEEISEEAACWIRSTDPRLWATAYFEGKRLGHLTANVVESFGTLILEASKLPIIKMIEYIREKLMRWFSERYESSFLWTSTLVPSAEKQVSLATEQAQSLQVLKVGDTEFEVFSDEGSGIVNIHTRACFCSRWQLCGLPCAHAVAALLSCKQNVYRFADSCFTVANYRKAYSQTIHPVPGRALWVKPSVGLENVGNNCVKPIIKPPKSLEPPGKPRKKRVHAKECGGMKRVVEGGRMKRIVHCSRCHQTGHIKTSCTAPL